MRYNQYNRPRWPRPVTAVLVVTYPLWVIPAAMLLCAPSAPLAWARELPAAWRWALRGEA